MNAYRIYRYTGHGDETVEYGTYLAGSDEINDTLVSALHDGGYRSDGATDWLVDVVVDTWAGKSMSPGTFYGRVVIEDVR